MQARTRKLEVTKLHTILAGQHLELVGDITDLVSEEAVEFVVQITLPEDFDEVFVG